MKILITGAGGFIGRNLCAVLKAGGEHEIFECEKDTPKDVLREFCRKADFVLCFSGANGKSGGFYENQPGFHR